MTKQKIRLWFPSLKKMVYPHRPTTDVEVIPVFVDDGGVAFISNNEEGIIMYNTGATDAKGTEVYTGDIVDYSHRDITTQKMVVEYDSKHARYILKNKTHSWDLVDTQDYYGHITVTGNIYESNYVIQGLC